MAEIGNVLYLSRDVPSSLGRYEVITSLGQGGMARVFLALQRGAFAYEKLVVLKQVRPELAADAEFVAMFMDEARIALQLNHPNVVHTYEVVAETPHFLLTMEYLEGRTLAQLLRKLGRDAFPTELHLWLLKEVLAALEYAHELRDLAGGDLGIVHRDVSPSNVFVTASGGVKLLDFGIAKAAGAVSFTKHGIMKGKLGYAAPEQCLGRPVDCRADLFAVGVMLWEAIAKRRMSGKESGLAAVQARIENREPSIEQVVPDVRPELARICKRALASSLSDRYGSAHEFKVDLEAYLSKCSPSSSSRKLGALVRANFSEELAAERAKVEAFVQEGRRTSVRPSFAGATQRISVPSTLAPDVPNRVEPSQPPRVGKRVALGAVAAVLIVAAAALWSFNPGSRVPGPNAAVNRPRVEPGAIMADVQPQLPPLPEPARPVLDPLSIASAPGAGQALLGGRPPARPAKARARPTPKRRSPPANPPVLAEEPAAKPRVVAVERSEQPVPAPIRSAVPTQPGQDLRKAVRASARIDDKDPYR